MKTTNNDEDDDNEDEEEEVERKKLQMRGKGDKQKCSHYRGSLPLCH